MSRRSTRSRSTLSVDQSVDQSVSNDPVNKNTRKRLHIFPLFIFLTILISIRLGLEDSHRPVSCQQFYQITQSDFDYSSKFDLHESTIKISNRYFPLELGYLGDTLNLTLSRFQSHRCFSVQSKYRSIMFLCLVGRRYSNRSIKPNYSGCF